MKSGQTIRYSEDCQGARAFGSSLLAILRWEWKLAMCSFLDELLSMEGLVHAFHPVPLCLKSLEATCPVPHPSTGQDPSNGLPRRFLPWLRHEILHGGPVRTQLEGHLCRNEARIPGSSLLS